MVLVTGRYEVLFLVYYRLESLDSKLETRSLLYKLFRLHDKTRECVVPKNIHNFTEELGISGMKGD